MKPVAELTKLSWYIASPGEKNGITNILFSQITIHDHEKLCCLNCLGVSQKHDKPDDYVYEKFMEQLGMVLRGREIGGGLLRKRNQFILETESPAFTK